MEVRSTRFWKALKTIKVGEINCLSCQCPRACRTSKRSFTPPPIGSKSMFSFSLLP